MRIQCWFSEIDREAYDITVDDRFSSEATLHGRETSIDLPGKVLVTQKELYAPGLHIVESRIDAAITLSNPWETEGLHVRFFFYLQGESHVRNGAGNQDYDHDVGLLQRNFLDTEGGGGTAIIPKNRPTHHIIVKMSHDFYLKLLANEYWIGDDAFHRYILNGTPENLPNENLRINRGMLQILESLMHNEAIGNRYHYVKLKLRELLFMIHQFTQDGQRSVGNLSPKTVDMMERIKSHLVINYRQPPTIRALSKLFFMDEKRLKAYFRMVHGSTIYAYVIRVRMEKAKQLLYEHYNVNEMAELLGYQSVSHFIKVFKSYHGQTPKDAMLEIQKITR